MNVIQPVIIQGPAAIEFDGAVYYTAGGLTISPERETNDTPSDFGPLGKTLKAQRTNISFTPVGERKNFAKHYPYTGAHIGKRIFNPGGAANKPIKIHTWEDQKTILFPRGALTKASTLYMSPNKTLFGDMGLTALGDSTKQPTDAAFWRSITGAGVFPTQFDEELVTKEVFHAALGELAAPYNAMSALSGFEFEPAYGIKWIEADEVGYADAVLESIVPTTKFIPANLTQEEVDTLLNMQGPAAIKVGQMFGVKGQHLVMASDLLTLTHKNAGAFSFTESYKTGEHRLKELTFVSRITWTAGVFDDLFTITENE